MTSTIAPDERRRHQRGEVLATAVVLASDGSSGVYLVKNLSAGGALLLGDARWNEGERVTVLLQLPGRKPLSLHAEVLRRRLSDAQELLFAIAFKQVPSELEDDLQKVVRAALENQREAPPHEVLVIDDSPARALGVLHAAVADLARSFFPSRWRRQLRKRSTRRQAPSSGGAQRRLRFRGGSVGRSWGSARAMRRAASAAP